MKQEGSAWALLPIGIFLVLFIGVGLWASDFSAMPAVVGLLIALMAALLQNRKVPFDRKLTAMSQGAGEENIMVMCVIFLLAGAFSGAVTAAGGADSVVNMGLSVLPPRFAVAGIFVIACFISLSMGTSMGTIAALAPIAAGISEKAGISLAVCTGAVVCGAMFGDNLSMISDTTIAATRTQGCAMKDKFRVNFFIVLPAAVITVIIFLALTWNSSFELAEELPFNVFQSLPYLFVLIAALMGLNVFFVLSAGTVLSLVAGVATGALPVSEIFTSVGNGVGGMFEITVISILVAGIVGIVRFNGGVDFLIRLISKRIRTQKGAELGIAGLISVMDMATANNTIAIVMTGPIAKEISDEFGVEPKRTASILDIFASVWQGVLPYGAQLLSAAKLTGLTPFAILPYLFYPILMGISGLISILFRKRTGKAGSANG
ncbi:MAG TPA: Na+/H+ antiporter NhaC family protein [Candidatus Merdivicinus excrementipullorum]|uniref:Na+/H+ antiporter NhaC family protein n=1 Tax=Candidatus Merdivicinus excrementipullorum TaxID=2840867 RepID=A0A9D1FN67_9FIRM|nr:Na+/H+ antiporter NhaC family protein [Candidatus Merdivicinus excrementipullorum]